ncbi:alpha/beta hydrolase family protein [Bdellovibrionota bacterium]
MNIAAITGRLVNTERSSLKDIPNFRSANIPKGLPDSPFGYFASSDMAKLVTTLAVEENVLVKCLDHSGNHLFTVQDESDHSANHAISDDGTNIVFSRLNNCWEQLCCYFVSEKKIKIIDSRRGAYLFPTFCDSGRAIDYLYASPSHPHNHCEYDFNSDKINFLTKYQSNLDLPSVTAIEIAGTQVMVHDPRKVSTKGKLPAIIHLNGAPEPPWMTWDPIIQGMSLNGFLVFRPNIIGKIGSGGDHYNKILGKAGVSDVENLLTVIEAIANLEYVDPDRLILFGDSYSGFTVMHALTKKNRLFKAGVLLAPVVDLPSFAKTRMKRWANLPYSDYFGPWDKAIECFQERNPLSAVSNIKCPLLLIHGKNDPGVPFAQTETLLKLLNEIKTPYETYFDLNTHGKNQDLQLINFINRLNQFLSQFS